MEDNSKVTNTVPTDSSLYDTDYFLSDCEGHAEFTIADELSFRLQKALACIDVKSGMRVLDVGCGRGESLAWLTQQEVEAWGMDYALAALELSKVSIRRMDLGLRRRCHLTAGNARRLPFASETFDRILMLDIVEHLHHWELEQALLEIRRVIKLDGRLIIHTAPNIWYYQFGYPLFRCFERFRGVQLPRNPRERFPYHQSMHVNEQSIWSLKNTLRQCGFDGRVWLTHLSSYSETYPGWMMKIMDLVQRLPLLRLIFCTHILAVATRQSHML
jgi:cyclopropane fatty-acyl-phospholipid synthase-like methyltransferase